MTIPVPNFSSPELRDAVASATPTIENVDGARNAMSEDIKKLEAYLQRIDLKVPFRYPLGMGFVGYPDMPDHQIQAALESHGAVSAWVEQEVLVWDEHKTTGKFRLLYEHNRWDGGVDIDAPGGPFFWDKETLQRQLKPLIEAKFDVRKRMYLHLPEFVRKLSEHCEIGDSVMSGIKDDMPF